MPKQINLLNEKHFFLVFIQMTVQYKLNFETRKTNKNFLNPFILIPTFAKNCPISLISTLEE